MARKPGDTLLDQEHAMGERRDDAKLLMSQEKRHPGAMYLLGYAVECALKRYIMRSLGVANLEAAKEALGKSHSLKVSLSSDHNLERLFAIAQAVGLDVQEDADLQEARSVVFHWTVDWRYMRRSIPPEYARYFEQQVDVLYHWINARLRRRRSRGARRH